MKELYSNGKLLLTAEYAILDGAKGLALPTTFGQFLRLGQCDSETLDWVSIDADNTPWFSASFSRPELKVIRTTDEHLSNKLQKILLEAKRLNPKFLSKLSDYNTIEAKLTFPRNWGLGSSSTLINNIAAWAHVDAYALLAATFGGSGYDIACAQHQTPLVYQIEKQKPSVFTLHYNLPFSDQLFFVYLNKKQNSRDAITAYRNLDVDKSDLIAKISAITEGVLKCSDLTDFESLLNTHEQIISKTLQTPTIKELLFSDYYRTIKSLGAWGGDFILATGGETERDYFKAKGYSTIVPYPEMIL